jgi:hypothetical protein
MKHGFLDETGDVGWAKGATRYLIVAAIITSNPHWLRKAVIKTRKRLRKKLKQIPELRAKRTPRKVVAKLLRYVATLDVEIVAVILDKESSLYPSDPEDWYRITCARVVRRCLERHPRLALTLDKRYTSQRLRDKQEQAIAKEVGDLSAFLVLRHSESGQEKAVQAADAVAWSLAQKYERGDEELYTIIQENIIVEEVLRT